MGGARRTGAGAGVGHGDGSPRCPPTARRRSRCGPGRAGRVGADGPPGCHRRYDGRRGPRAGGHHHGRVDAAREARALFTSRGRAGAQTARLLRPLRRREDKTARPARVRMRSRNPCTLWRRRLFGWYVRLLTSSLRFCSGAVTPAVSQITRWSDGAGAKLRGFGRHRPPTRGTGRLGQISSVDMRHPSTPGDRGTVRAASPRRQIATRRPRPTDVAVENQLRLPPRLVVAYVPSACG